MSTKLLSVFSRDIFNLLENLEEFNVTIHVGEQPNVRIFHAHSLILKARSSYFNTALSKQWAKQKDEKNILNQPNISPEIFEIILSYIYSGKISLQERTITEILEILSAGDELLLNDLLDYIQDYLVDTKADWLPNYILEIYRKTLDHQSCEKLREFILATISADPELLFNSKDFLKIEESLLLPILKRDDLDMAEDEVWDQIVNWGIAQDLDLHPAIKEWDYDDFNKLKTILDKCIPLIRFFQMSSSDLYDKVWSPFRLILPPNLEDDIVRCHLKQGSKPIYGINTPRGNSTLIGHKEMLRIAYWIDKNDTPISNSSHININSHSHSNSSAINISSSLLSSTPISSTSTNNNNINTNNSSSSASNIPATTNEMPYKFKLLVRGTRDGFDSKTFHQKCDNQGPTFVIMRISSTNEVIGGYNPIKWQIGSGHLETRDSFLFTFGNRDRIEDAKVSRVSRFNYAITLKDDSYGPCFGDKDLWMYGNFDKPESCSSKEDDYETWITKSRKFGVSEYEVFKIIKK